MTADTSPLTASSTAGAVASTTPPADPGPLPSLSERVLLHMGNSPRGDNWHPPEKNAQGEHFCWSGPGERATVSIPVRRDHETLAIVAYERSLIGKQLTGLRIEVDGATVPHTVRADLCPKCIVARLPAVSAPFDSTTELALVLPRTVSPSSLSADNPDARHLGLGVIFIAVIPLKPTLPEEFPASRLQLLGRRVGLAAGATANGDFPLSHFDGAAYLEEFPDVADAVRQQQTPSAVDHYIQYGCAEGRRFALAVHGAPNRGTTEELLQFEFDGLAYLRANPDVARAVRRQEIPSALHHYVRHGHAEGRTAMRLESGEVKVGNLSEILEEQFRAELAARTQVLKEELQKQFSSAITHSLDALRQEVQHLWRLEREATQKLDGIRGELAAMSAREQVSRAQIDALKASLVSVTTRSGIARPKLYVDVQHGLSNRLKAFASASAIAEKTGREVVLVWVPDHHCQCRFSDLFEYDGPVVSEPIHIDRQQVGFYNYMEIEPGAEKDKPIDLDTPRDIYVRSAYALNTLLTDWHSENRLLRSLRPSESVRNLVDSIDVTGRVGVHVRMEAGAGLDHHSYDSSANWSEESHQKIQFWRAKSHYAKFIRRIDILLKEDPDLQLFLATDMGETYRIFREAYGERLAILEREVYDRSREQMIYALADAILLGKCARFLGSTYSTFSELAVRYSTGFKFVEMSGKDF